MQIKLVDGTIHQVAQAEVQRLAHMLPKSNTVHLDAAQDKQWLTGVLKTLHECAVQHKHKAAKLVKHIADLDTCPQQYQQVRDALTEVLMYGPAWDKSAIIMAVSQWIGSRKAEHIIHHAIKEL